MKVDMCKSDARMALGFVWRRDGKEDMDNLIAEADRRMYADKMEWYRKRTGILLEKER